MESALKGQDLHMRMLWHNRAFPILRWAWFSSICAMPHFAREAFLCREVVMIISVLRVKVMFHWRKNVFSAMGMRPACPHHSVSFNLSLPFNILPFLKIFSYHLASENSWEGCFYQQMLLEIDTGGELQERDILKNEMSIARKGDLIF